MVPSLGLPTQISSTSVWQTPKRSNQRPEQPNTSHECGAPRHAAHLCNAANTLEEPSTPAFLNSDLFLLLYMPRTMVCANFAITTACPGLVLLPTLSHHLLSKQLVQCTSAAAGHQPAFNCPAFTTSTQSPSFVLQHQLVGPFMRESMLA